MLFVVRHWSVTDSKVLQLVSESCGMTACIVFLARQVRAYFGGMAGGEVREARHSMPIPLHLQKRKEAPIPCVLGAPFSMFD